MLMLVIISAILMIGFLLIILEIFFIPGTTLVGLLGLIFNIAGIVVIFSYYGNETGFIVLICTTLIKLGLLFYAFTVKPWMKFSHKQAITSRVNQGLLESFHVGDTGKTVSALRPMGKVLFGQQEIEVKTSGFYVENGVPVIITGIQSNQIIVEPIK